MGKSGTTLGIISLILAAGGLGLGSLAWVSVIHIETQVASFSEQNTWYRYNGTAFNCDPASTYLTFSGLTVEFELGTGESVYFSFNAQAHTEDVPSSWSRIYVYFRVDGIMQFDPSAEVGCYFGDYGILDFMLNLQDVRDDLAPGTHHVTIVIWGDTTANYIHKSSLFVQKVST